MVSKKVGNDDIEELYKILVSVKNTEDCKMLLSDLCTDREIEKMAERIRAAKLLIEGKTYNQVIEETDISSATLSRVSRCVQYGDGYKKFLRGKK